MRRLASYRKIAGLWAGVAAFVLVAFLGQPLGQGPAFAAAGSVLTLVWWLTEPFPLHVTACVPLVVFPLTGAFGPDRVAGLIQTALAYVHPYVFLVAGGMGIAAAMKSWDLHRRLALSVMSRFGSDPERLLFGVLAATAFVSLWISNTAATAMMLPLGISVLDRLREQHGRRLSRYGMALMLAIAYGANVGGIGTKIGTTPNATLTGFLHDRGVEISFAQYLIIGLPFVILFMPVVWLALRGIALQEGLGKEMGQDLARGELERLGPLRGPEKVVLGVLVATAAFWVLSKGLFSLLAASDLFFKPSLAQLEGGIAVAAALILLVWRSGGRRVLPVSELPRLSWSTLLLLGGSFAIGEAVEESGLSAWFAAHLGGLRELPPFPQIVLASGVSVVLSSVVSNIATITVLLAVLQSSVPPEVATTAFFAATIACSCDFAFPIGTPPNAMVFAHGYVTVPGMARTGLLLGPAGAILAAVWCWLVVRWVVG